MSKILIKKMSGAIAIILAFVIFTLFSSSAGAIIYYYASISGCDNGILGLRGGKAYNQNGISAGNELAVGCIVQYIYAGANNTIDPPRVSGLPSGDDVLILERTIGSDNWYYAFENQPGLFVNLVNGTCSNPSPKLYVRAWNASSLLSSTHYGDSLLFNPSVGAGIPSVPNEIGLTNIVTIIPFKPIEILVPTITSITPNCGANNTTTHIVIRGTNFYEVSAAYIGTDYISAISVVNSTEIVAIVQAGLAPGHII